MNLGNSIHRLLLENDTVIVPGFGAFVTRYKSAEIDSESGSVFPPSREVSFHPNIRNNDGLLVGYVAGILGISHFDALKWVEKERDNLFYQLDREGRVTLEETGVLFFSEHHEVCFSPFEEENLLLDSYGLNVVSLDPDVSHKSQLNEKPFNPETSDDGPSPDLENEDAGEQSTVRDEEKNMVDENPDTIEKQDDEHENREQDNQTESALVFSGDHLPKMDNESHGKREEKQNDTEKDVASGSDSVFVYHEEIHRESGNSGKIRWWYLLILLPIVLAGVYIIYQKGKNGKNEKNENQILDVTLSGTPQTLDSLFNTSSDSAMVRDTAMTDSTKAGKIPSEQVNLPKYVLVGGSFRDEENAELFIGQLKSEGYQPFHLGKRGNFFMVGIGRYHTEKEAVEARDEYTEKKPDSGVWVMKDEFDQ